MSEGRSILVRVIEWLLGLDRIQLGRDAPLRLVWDSPHPGWVVVTLSVLVLLFIAFAYRRERGRLRRRVVLAGVRLALAGLLIALLGRPTLILQRNRVSPSQVALMVDTSASMGLTDRYVDESLAGAVARGAHLANGEEVAETSRLDLVRRSLGGADHAALRTVLERNRLEVVPFAGGARWLGGAVGAEELGTAVAQMTALTAEGRTTGLASSLEQVLTRSEDGRLAAVILASDGRSTDALPLNGPIALARAQQIPIYALRIGSPAARRDVGIGGLRAERRVFAKDVMAVRAEVFASGLAEATPIELQLVDVDRDRVVARSRVELGGERTRGEVELRAKPIGSGRRRYRVEVVPSGEDADAENNSASVEVRVHDDPLRVLYVEQRPRFEYRYLKNALVREQTIRAAVLLLGADEAFAQEGTDPIRRFPETAEELANYDVVLFGDVAPSGDWLTEAQVEMLVDYVGQQGGGFGMIAGEHNAPHRFRGTGLERLIPVRVDPEPSSSSRGTQSAAFAPQLTPEGSRSRLFRFDLRPSGVEQADSGLFGPGPSGPGPSGSEGEGTSLVSSLPGWFWYARTLGPARGAEVLLAHPHARTESGPMPLVVVGRYGAGKVLFHGSDDTWRWRRGAGELIYDGYWVQVVRALSRARPAEAGQGMEVRVRKARYACGERVSVAVRINDSELLARAGERVRLTVRDPDGQAVARLDAVRLGGASPCFEGSFVPRSAGTFTIAAEELGPVGPGLASGTDGAADPGAAALIQVDQAGLEVRHREADHEALERLAEETGGAVVPLDDLSEAFSAIRDRSQHIPDDVREALWDSRLTLILFVVLITCEWTLRKLSGMI
ncbi:MAG: hypothetical protein GY842_01595 [bacterium]|nr:hypothetical protein [bacterium]